MVTVIDGLMNRKRFFRKIPKLVALTVPLLFLLNHDAIIPLLLFALIQQSRQVGLDRICSADDSSFVDAVTKMRVDRLEVVMHLRATLDRYILLVQLETRLTNPRGNS